MYRYAKAGEIHDGVHPSDLEIIAEDGTLITHVIEANATEGWFIQFKRNDKGEVFVDGDKLLTERVEMKFVIRRRAG